MKRRHFIQKSLFTGLMLGAAPTIGWSQSQTMAQFRLKYAPHLGMFENLAGKDPMDQLSFMADQGFTAFEDNMMSTRPKALQEQMASHMDRLGLKMGVFVAHTIYWKEANLASGNTDKRKEFLQEIKNAVQVAKRVNAQWMTVVPGYTDLTKDYDLQMAHVIETLKQAAAILESHGLVMVLEPLNFRDHPGMFLSKSAQAYQICRAVDSPACKILFDIYHQQIQEGNLLPNIEAYWDEIAYFQIGDNPGRNEPGTGEINYQNVFKYIHERGFNGILGMEHGNSQEGKAGEKKVIDAYRWADRFG